MTLQDFINEYGTYAQIAVKDILGNTFVYNVSDVVESSLLFSEISSGAKVIYGAYASPISTLPPPPPPFILPSASQSQATLNGLLRASRVKFESLYQLINGARNFLLEAPYLVSFENIAYPTPLDLGQVSSDQDPRLTDGQTDFQVYSQGQSLNLADALPIFFQISGADIQATASIPLPDYARLVDLSLLSLRVINDGINPIPNSIAANLDVISGVSNKTYVVPYVLNAETVTPASVGGMSYAVAGLNTLVYMFEGNGIGPVGTQFHGEAVENFSVAKVTFIITTLPNSIQTYLDEAQAVFQTNNVDSTPVIGGASLGSGGLVGLANEVVLWSGNKSIFGDPNFYWDPVAKALTVDGSMVVSDLQVTGSQTVVEGKVFVTNDSFLILNSGADVHAINTDGGVQISRLEGSQSISNVYRNINGEIEITTASPHQYFTGDRVLISSVAGTTEANNTDTLPYWTITIQDAFNFLLGSSTFTNSYVSGGFVARHANAQLSWSESNGRFQSVVGPVSAEVSQLLAYKYIQVTGDGLHSAFNIVHALNSLDVVVSLRETSAPYDEVIADVTIVNVNTVQVSFSSPPADLAISVTVVG